MRRMVIACLMAFRQADRSPPTSARREHIHFHASEYIHPSGLCNCLWIGPAIAFHGNHAAELSHSKNRMYPGRSRLRRLTRLTQIGAFKNNSAAE
jgi:hypothetical protein